MKLSVNNIFDNINDFSKEVKIFINSENFDVVKGFELLDKYKDLSTFLVSQKNIPEEVVEPEVMDYESVDKDLEDLKPKHEEKSNEHVDDDTLENDLFDLIDSMYDNREDGDI